MKAIFTVLLIIFLCGVLGAATSTARWRIKTISGRTVFQWEDDYSFTANGNYDLHTGQCNTITFHVYGTFTANVNVYGSVDGTNWQSLHAGDTLTAAGWVVIVDESWAYYRVTVSSYSSGTVNVAIMAR